MGGDYSSKLAEKQGGASKQATDAMPHTYPDGTTGGDYPAHLKAKVSGLGF
jgi:hypothetical protein